MDIAVDRPVARCPVEEAIQVIGGKWKLLILRSLLLNGPQRYNELLASVTGISAKELTRNLRALADSQLVAQEEGAGRLGGYRLTSLGKELMPMFQQMLTWGTKLLESHENLTHIPVR